MADIRILFEILDSLNPRLYRKLKDLIADADGSHATVMTHAFQWFVCLYTNNKINKVITKIIWDYLLIDGSIILFKAALAIISMV